MSTEPTTSVEGRPPPWRVVFSGRRGRLTTGLLLLEALVAIQALVVATIMPDIRHDLGMVALYGLAFTAPSLATIAAIPIAGRALDRVGARPVLLLSLGLFASGLLVAGTAPVMPILLVGQFLVGAGGGGLYAMSLGTVAKSYPDDIRPRVLALLATMWILPGLIGPPFGALVASTVGWRWAFLAPIPVMTLGWFLIAPALELVPPPDQGPTPLAVRWPLQLMVGAGIALTSLTVVRWWALGTFLAGIAIASPALRRIVPRGTLRAARGIPAAGMSAFLLSVGFLSLDAFLTLMLTDVRGLTLAEASLAITGATVAWAAGSLWQSGRAGRISLPRLALAGTLLVIVGGAAVASALWPNVPLAVAFVGWLTVGVGMGITFPTIPLAAMRQAGVGEESSELSSVLLMDVLGVAIGAGLGGGAVALSQAFGASLASGIGGSFAIGLVALILLVVTSRRIA
ncbi:MAG: MFS transporter [Actinomycetota bacterium]